MVFALYSLVLLATRVMCGEHRIVGGYDAKEGAFPYQVSLRKGTHHFCGGSLLNKHWILTAAHCVEGQNAEEITAVVGTNYLSEGGNSYGVEELIAHPLYSSHGVTNDIALIKLKDAILYTSTAKPIKLPVNDTMEGTKLILSGWGSTSYPGKAPDKLQTIELLSISNIKCITQHPLGGILPTNLCTFTKEGEGACRGDSGGPLVQDGEHQVGIVSWGVPCAKGKPDVFTRVYSYLNWIENHTGKIAESFK